MFDFFKKLTETPLEKKQKLRLTITENYQGEDWFANNFQENGLYDSEIEDQDFETYVYMLSADIREALLLDYLVKNDYLKKLQLKEKQLVYKDSYGDCVTDEWIKESYRFAERRIDDVNHYLQNYMPIELVTLRRDDLDPVYFDDDILELASSIRMIVSFEDEDEDEDEEITQNITPYEYEKLIASQFNQLGWDAYTTSGSGDQGADVIAEKDGLLFVVQCKMYSQPVGNKAVQEVSSAKDYYDAAGAVVVTNNDYTKSARQLADSQNVWLIHDSQIASWCLMIEEALED